MPAKRNDATRGQNGSSAAKDAANGAVELNGARRKECNGVVDEAKAASALNGSVAKVVEEGANGSGKGAEIAEEKERKKGSKRNNFLKKFSGLIRSDVKSEWNDYDATFAQKDGKGITDKEHTKDGVEKFYNLVTDIYEWGWGPSFHFSPRLKGKGIAESSVAHETRIADNLGLKPGEVALDVGCGIGGPLITIASHSGAKVVGVTINSYQVERCKARAIKAGLKHKEDFDVVQGNFLDLQFEDNSMDHAYAIEATCHSPDLEKAYSEIFRVLKPGGKFVNYEWVSTSTFDPSNPDHVKCIDEINYANALPEMRTHADICRAAKKVGFDVLVERDLALTTNATEWWGILKTSMKKYKLNDIIIRTLSFLRVLPKETKDVHKMLYGVLGTFIDGGEMGIFSPMYMVVLQKPRA